MRKQVFQMIFLGVCISLYSTSLIGQSDRKVQSGAEEAYDVGDYDTSEEGYALLLDRNPSSETAYNLGNALYQNEKYEDAIQHYKKAINDFTTPEDLSKAWFNLGNSLYQINDLEGSIHAFKEALKNNVNDHQARHNLLLAKKELEAQEQSQDDKDQESDSDNEDQPSPEEQSQDNQEDENQSQPEQEVPESVDQLLKIMEEEERKVQQKMKKQHERQNRSTKRW